MREHSSRIGARSTIRYPIWCPALAALFLATQVLYVYGAAKGSGARRAAISRNESTSERHGSRKLTRHADGIIRSPGHVRTVPGMISTRTHDGGDVATSPMPNDNIIDPTEFVEEHNAYRCELGLEPLAW